jgi:hypothetical protein
MLHVTKYFTTGQETLFEILLGNEVPLRNDTGQKSNSHTKEGVEKNT